MQPGLHTIDNPTRQSPDLRRSPFRGSIFVCLEVWLCPRVFPRQCGSWSSPPCRCTCTSGPSTRTWSRPGRPCTSRCPGKPSCPCWRCCSSLSCGRHGSLCGRCGSMCRLPTKLVVCVESKQVLPCFPSFPSSPHTQVNKRCCQSRRAVPTPVPIPSNNSTNKSKTE